MVCNKNKMANSRWEKLWTSIYSFNSATKTDKPYKKYYRHTGHPGGIKEITPEKLNEKNKPSEVLKLAVKRMLPSGPLAKKQLTKLKIYTGENHPHTAQNPTMIELGKLNSKNLIRN